MVPGSAFGDDRYVRMSYAAATADVERALEKIIGFARKLGD
jgi:aspartate/methionine/tyrosine aminotransferase